MLQLNEQHGIIKVMSKQLVFIDDSGDPGFVSGVSNANLLMAGALFIDPETATRLNEEITRFRKTLGWQDNHEFKFRKAPKDIKIRFLELVCNYEFDIYAVYVDKTRYQNTFHFTDREKLYNWTAKELLKAMPLDEAYVKIDGRSSREHKLRVASYLRKEINANRYRIKEVKTQDSVKDNLIQLADMVVGAIGRSFQPEKTDSDVYIRIIRHKIKSIKSLNLQ